ncbi:MAG: hypothetical protein AVO35_00690 [Candidatus Aegiribacteria sp. MLS_C]|nr:MAG: hypothetical protein AVO35_00690 [Candidatus Aegiribacteria sp. MLS_C]
MELDPVRMVLDLKTLHRGVNTGSFTVPMKEVAWDIEDVLPASGKGILELTVDLEDGAVICAGILHADFTTPCARCLEPTRFQVVEEIFREFALTPGTSGEEREMVPDTGLLDLMEAVREAVILSVPVKPLCSSDCPGIDYI